MDNLDFYIKDLIKVVDFDKNIVSKLKNFTGIDLPIDYVEFIQNYKSLEGTIGRLSYICLWGGDSLIENNIGYEVQEFHPDLFLIGSDMGGMGFCIHKTHKYYVEIDLCSIDEGFIIAKNFKEFLAYLFYWEPPFPRSS